jgi:hypothetical protein
MSLNRLVLTGISTLLLFLTQAQSGFVKAYIISLKGDTVWGEARINPKKEHDNFDRVIFKDTKGQQKSYDSDKIRGFGYKDMEYIVMEQDGEDLFYRVMTRGPITMYKQMFPGFRMNKLSWETEYFIETKDTEKPVLLREAKIKKQLTQYMQDNPEFINAYDEAFGFEVDKVLETIIKYNAWKKTSGT